MKPGDLILVRGTSFTDHCVEDIEHSPYSHVAIVVTDKLTIEDEPFFGVHYEEMSFWSGEDVYTHPSLTDKQRADIVAWAEGHMGDHYAWGLLLWEITRYTIRLALPWYTLPGFFICSTFASDAYCAVGSDLWPDIKYPSPADDADAMVYAGKVP